MAMHFDFTDLQLVANLAESHSLTAGAEKSHLSLPAVSTRIKNLEEHFAAQLLYRTSQGVTLTSAGQALAQHARRILMCVEEMRGDMHQYGEGVKGHVRVLANTTAMADFMPRIARKFLLTHPGVNVELRERLSVHIVKAVREGAADIGIVAGSQNLAGIQFLPCRSDRLVLVTPRQHPLAGLDTTCFGDTLDYDYVGLSEWSAIHPFLLQAANNLGRALRFRVEVSNFETVCRMIESGVGIGVIPEAATRQFRRRMNLAVVTLQDEWAVRRLQVCVRDLQALPAFSQKFVDYIMTDAQEAQDDLQAGDSELPEPASEAGNLAQLRSRAG